MSITELTPDKVGKVRNGITMIVIWLINLPVMITLWILRLAACALRRLCLSCLLYVSLCWCSARLGNLLMLWCYAPWMGGMDGCLDVGWMYVCPCVSVFLAGFLAAACRPAGSLIRFACYGPLLAR